MSAYANTVVGHLLAQSWQIALLAGIVGLISLALRNRSAHLRYLLWLIVLAKCLAPPVVTVPLAVLPDRPEIPPVGLTDFSEERSASEVPVFVGQDPKPRQSARTVPDVREVVALAWTAGVLFFLLWVGGRTIRYTAWLRERRKPLSSDLWASVENSSLGFRFRKWPRIWLLDEIRQPFVWGLLRGSVYLPADFAGVGDSDRQRNILAHEFSHVARFDAGVNLLQILAQAVYWFHPFVWWANRRIRQEREKCCDEMAVARLHTPPERYTGAIVEALAAEHRSAHPIPSLAIVGSVKDIEERIRTMLKPGKIFRTRPTLLAATVASLIALVTVPTALVLTAKGQPQPPIPVETNERPEQPRYAARTFNSQMAFSVWVMVDHSGTWGVGNTPSATPLEIPPCWCWGVYTRSPVKDWDMLAREISLNKIPGLWLDSCTDSDVKHLAGLRNLHLLYLPETAITDAGLESLQGLTGLEELGLENTRVTDAGLAHLKGLTKLRVLYLARTRITNAGLQYLKGLTNLRGLDLNETQITDAGLQHLAGLTKLSWLRLNGTRVTDTGLEHLQRLTALASLQLGDTQVTARGFARLKALPSLGEMHLNSRTITDDADLANLVDSLPRLTRLNLGGTPITDAGLAHIRRLTGLHHLVLLGTQITDAGLADIESLTELQYLLLAGTRITDAGLEHLKGLRKLSALGLERTQITDAGLEHLQGLKGLGKLYLNDTRIGDVGLEHLQGLTTLFWLDLTGTQITDAGLQHLQNLTRLSTLGLVGTGITDAGLKHLRGLTSLRGLALLKTQVTDAGVRELKQSLPNLTIYSDPPQPAAAARANREGPEPPRFAARTFNSKADLDVWVQETAALWSIGRIGSTPSDAPLEVPACWLWGVRLKGPVNDWDLLRREMNENEVPGLAARNAVDSDLRQLAGLRGLRSLDLSYSKITDAGLESLKDMSRLEQLNLRETGITDAGLEYLATLTGLQELRLGNAQITDAGLKCLKGLTGLQVLGLGRTRITDAGLEELKGLGELRQLIVPFDRSQVTDTGVQQLQQALPNLTIQRAPLGAN
jgi:beta-lactamase regulating signal transducer with metallopeptidase domain/Leucine-rich repeat (LRR) protein